MSSKRPPSPELIPNPFIKRKNLAWTIQPHGTSLIGSGTQNDDKPATPPPSAKSQSISAAIESGALKIEDHPARFSALLSHATLSPFPAGTPRLRIEAYRQLYESCLGSKDGAHFVIHQHDHPVAGTHYDLRLQINETSSVSWAIMYGLPGDPNSVRQARNATETRIHCLWNHLIETASAESGPLLIWDTGTYSILPRRSKNAPAIDPSSQGSTTSTPGQSEQQKLSEAFASRKIRLQLHGTRLPQPYVLNLRLTKKEDAIGRTKGMPRRRRRKSAAKPLETSSESEEDAKNAVDDADEEDIPKPLAEAESKATEALSAMERELHELEDEQVRRSNAYPGAENSIGSIHQRRWYLSLDRKACGFVEKRSKGKLVWECPPQGEEDATGKKENKADDEGRLIYPFYVRGPEYERSVITGRLRWEILRDEKVTGFTQRRGWNPVLN